MQPEGLTQEVFINKGINLVGLFVACLCRADAEYSRYSFVDASRQTTNIPDDIETFIYRHLLSYSILRRAEDISANPHFFYT
jgi:hypothetical protein